MSSPLTRRAAIRRALLFSAALAAPRFVSAQPRPRPRPGTLNLFCFGDWGGHEPGDRQADVAAALQAYARTTGIIPDALFLLGDNFYGPMPGGTDSPRWRREFEDMYPASVFPGPCYALLGNHDYDDQRDGEKAQLAYGRSRPTRWTMPDRWYRADLPAANPVATFLNVNTHYAKLGPADIAAQEKWLAAQLAAPRRAPWMIVCGHHPVHSCSETHGDTPYLAGWKKFLPGQRAHVYLCGHDHDLQHLREPGGFTDWLVSGGGGKSIRPVNRNARTQFAEAAFGFLHLAIRSDHLTGTFVGLDAAPLYAFDRSAHS